MSHHCPGQRVGSLTDSDKWWIPRVSVPQPCKRTACVAFLWVMLPCPWGAWEQRSNANTQNAQAACWASAIKSFLWPWSLMSSCRLPASMKHSRWWYYLVSKVKSNLRPDNQAKVFWSTCVETLPSEGMFLMSSCPCPSLLICLVIFSWKSDIVY